MANPNLTINVRFRIGWRWKLAMFLLPYLLRSGMSESRSLRILNRARRHARINVAGQGWIRADLPEIIVGDGR